MNQLDSKTSFSGIFQRILRQAKQRPAAILVLLEHAHEIGQRILPAKFSKYSKKSEGYPPAQLFAMYALKVYRDLSYREVEEEFQSSREKRGATGMTEVPDHSTLQRFVDKLLPETIEAAQRLTALHDPWKPPAGGVGASLALSELAQTLQARDSAAVDSTGFFDSSASAYYCKRTGDKRFYYSKLSLNGSLSTQKILAAVVDRGPCSDHIEFKPLVHKAEQVVRLDLQIGDAGYDSEANHRFCHARGIQSLFPVKMGRPSKGGPASTPLRRSIQQNFPAHLYRQRSKATETVFSSMKRKSGSILRARLSENKDKEVWMKVVFYNLHRDIVRVRQVPLHRLN